jgi:signal transduction histidine kinase
MLHYNGIHRWIDIKVRPAKDVSTGKIHFVGSGNEIHGIMKSEENSKKFMNFASHEIKTPLTAIQTYLEIVERRIKAGNIDEIDHFIKKARSNITTLTELINSFLDITRAQVGKILIDLNKEDVSEVVKKVTEQSEYIYKSHHIKLLGVKSAIVLMDKKRITQVLDNIISNAVRYSPKNSDVTVSQTVKGGKAVITIKDNGVGIPSSEHKKIFRKYYQLKRNPYKVVGMGMGLYLARTIIKKHKGTIGLTSKVGKGTTFIIELPLAS